MFETTIVVKNSNTIKKVEYLNSGHSVGPLLLYFKYFSKVCDEIHPNYF